VAQLLSPIGGEVAGRLDSSIAQQLIETFLATTSGRLESAERQSHEVNGDCPATQVNTGRVRRIFPSPCRVDIGWSGRSPTTAVDPLVSSDPARSLIDRSRHQHRPRDQDSMQLAPVSRTLVEIIRNLIPVDPGHATHSRAPAGCTAPNCMSWPKKQLLEAGHAPTTCRRTHPHHPRRHRRAPPRANPEPQQRLPTHRRTKRPQTEKVPNLTQVRNYSDVLRHHTSSGDRIRTCDLWVMSPASYRAAPPRDG
jgi:hypothetical protein